MTDANIATLVVHVPDGVKGNPDPITDPIIIVGFYTAILHSVAKIPTNVFRAGDYTFARDIVDSAIYGLVNDAGLSPAAAKLEAYASGAARVVLELRESSLREQPYG